MHTVCCWQRNLQHNLFYRRLLFGDSTYAYVVCLRQFNNARNLSRSSVCWGVTQSLDSVLATRLQFINNPLMHLDLYHLMVICDVWIYQCLTLRHRQSLTSSLEDYLLRYWRVADFLLNSSSTFTESEDWSRYQLLLFNSLALSIGWSFEKSFQIINKIGPIKFIKACK